MEPVSVNQLLIRVNKTGHISKSLSIYNNKIKWSLLERINVITNVQTCFTRVYIVTNTVINYTFIIEDVSSN